jgi:Leucine-rich repeat (LRR) protein
VLDKADKLRWLYVYNNSGLTSLTGLCTQALEELYAGRCGLKGDLSTLEKADKLRELYVSHNSGLNSLNGDNTQALEELYAKECSLQGDHNFLTQAKTLKGLDLRDNPKSLTLDRSLFNPNTKVQL